MNIGNELNFNPGKVGVLTVQKDANGHVFAVGLLRGQILSKHMTAVPALLTVLEGSIVFRMNDSDSVLNRLDTFSIPVGIEHEVIGTDERNIFLIVKSSLNANH